MKISKNDKKDWIIEYMTHPEHKDHFIDITGEEFVNAYVDKFEPEVIEWYPYGHQKFLRLENCLRSYIKKIKCLGADIIVIYGRMAIQDGFIYTF